MPIYIPPDIRPKRYPAKYSVAAAASCLRIPEAWIWAGIALRTIKRTVAEGRVYVRLENVIEAIRENAQELAMASGVLLASPDQVVAVRGFQGELFDRELATPDALGAEASYVGR